MVSRIVTSKVATENAIARIEERMNDCTNGIHANLYSRWSSLNALVGKGFPFGKTTVIYGSSGTGKSYLFNMLANDFSLTKDIHLTKDIKIEAINSNLKDKDKLITLYFNLEMEAEDEKLRTISALLSRSYNYLLSSQYTYDDNTETFDYNNITKEELKVIKLLGDKLLKEQGILYVEGLLTLSEMIAVVKNYYDRGYKIIVMIDHLLLINAEDGSNDNDLKLLKKITIFADEIKKKYNVAVFILNQMNDGILDAGRISNNLRHYPDMTDGYGGRTIYHAGDTGIFLHRPNRIGIKIYGPDKIKTSIEITKEVLNLIQVHNNNFDLDNSDINKRYDVIHMLIHKNRFGGDIQSIFFLAVLNKGKFVKVPISILL